jgi:hypothetical protein
MNRVFSIYVQKKGNVVNLSWLIRHTYLGSNGSFYGVDSGTIGVVPRDLWKNTKPCCQTGQIMKVNDKLIFSAQDGIFKIICDDLEILENNSIHVFFRYIIGSKKFGIHEL